MMIIPHLILKRGDKILLTKRSATNKIWSGHWHCVTGGIEEGESPKEAIIREAKEEIGIDIDIKNARLGTTVFLVQKDYFNQSKKFYALELFFVSNLDSYLDNEQRPANLEPLKQDDMKWFSPDNLPKPMIPGVDFGIKSYFKNQNYVEFYNLD
jgi:8-oxo-dGTP diphosphatase